MRVQFGERLALVASKFGWDPSEALDLAWEEGDHWTATADLELGYAGAAHDIRAYGGMLWSLGCCGSDLMAAVLISSIPALCLHTERASSTSVFQ